MMISRTCSEIWNTCPTPMIVIIALKSAGSVNSLAVQTDNL